MSSGPTVEQQQARLRSLRAVALVLQKEGAATHNWRLQRTQEDQQVRLEEEESALARYQENAQLLTRLFTPTEEETEQGRWAELREKSLQSELDVDRVRAYEGDAKEPSSAGATGRGISEGAISGGLDVTGTRGVFEDLEQVIKCLHPGETSEQEGSRKQALEKLRSLAREFEIDGGGGEGSLPVSPRKGKRKAEPQEEAKAGCIESFGQLLVEAGNVTSNLEIRESERAYLQALKKACHLPRLPEGEDAISQECWPVCSKQSCRTRLDGEEEDDMQRHVEVLTSCQL
ncbi:hypothetical protein KFL_003970040 [Klebsormidium nitens]|uniref:Uncharacterized protein n=1 Tax=Klebsormidium nitens TaxID=105231 RepID=A0A1Y1IH70_KLENI|nr:hypothetical protein KFL_003970040 [Klebsormidium nitens]|eukprot:GAQ88057.1 hypothetical protein KFL_003970040 [Klebsormidium nitens]